MNLKFTKEQLEAALEARRPWARALDKKRKAQHAKDEKAFTERLRDKLRAALKWDYEKCKKQMFEVSLDYAEKRQRPECPEGVEANLDKAISHVAMDGRERYVLSKLPPKRYGYNDTSWLYWLLTHRQAGRVRVNVEFDIVVCCDLCGAPKDDCSCAPGTALLSTELAFDRE